MLSYTQRRNLFGKLSNNEEASNLTLGDTLMNEADREIVTDKRFNFRVTSTTLDTVASQQFYDLPADIGSLNNVTILVDTTLHTPDEITTRRQWDIVNQTTSVTADTPDYYYLDKQTGQVGFYPKPTSDGNTITFNYLRNFKNLTLADYTTGTIVTATNGSTAIVGGSTSWTAKMADRWIRFDDSNTANTGDGFWYEISSITDGTHLVLEKNYQGISIAAGSGTYIIAQVSLIPETHQILPVYKALEIYFTSVQPEENRAVLYKRLFEDGLVNLRQDQMNKTTSPVVSDLRNEGINNPNLFVEA